MENEMKGNATLGEVSAGEEMLIRKDRKNIFEIILPIAAVAVVLTGGIIASSISLGLFHTETHEAFIATKQSALP